MKKLGLIVAMPEELALVKKTADDFRLLDDSAFKIFTYILHNSIEGFAICSGIGKVNAAAAATLLLSQYAVDAIVNIGIAGGVSDDLVVGDVLLATSHVYYDVDVTVFGYQYGQVPRMPTHYTYANPRALDAKNLPFSVVEGMLCTGDSFVTSRAHLNDILDVFPNIKALDMEGAAIAQICYLFQKPFMSLKGISDGANDDSAGDSEQNLHVAMKNVVDYYQRILEKNSHLIFCSV